MYLHITPSCKLSILRALVMLKSACIYLEVQPASETPLVKAARLISLRGRPCSRERLLFCPEANALNVELFVISLLCPGLSPSRTLDSRLLRGVCFTGVYRAPVIKSLVRPPEQYVHRESSLRLVVSALRFQRRLELFRGSPSYCAHERAPILVLALSRCFECLGIEVCSYNSHQLLPHCYTL